MPSIKEIVAPMVNALQGHATLEEHPNGRITAWVLLANKIDLVAASRSLKGIGARLSMITAMTNTRPDGHMIAYHFDIAGSTVTLKVMLEPGASVETIVPVFRNADWHEREIIEFFEIAVTGRADNRRLFLEEGADPRKMEKLIPLSMLANAASTKTLWERLNEAKEAK